MSFQRVGNSIQNTDSEAYANAKKRKELQKERKKKDELLEQLAKRVNILEIQVKSLMEKFNDLG